MESRETKHIRVFQKVEQKWSEKRKGRQITRTITNLVMKISDHVEKIPSRLTKACYSSAKLLKMD